MSTPTKPRPITYEMDARERKAIRAENKALGYSTPSDGSAPTRIK